MLCSLMLMLSGAVLSQSSTMTIREVFDFQPGDIFHLKKFYPSYQPAYFGAIRYEITSRTVSPGNDTVCYTEQHFDYDAEHQGTLHINYSFQNYSKLVCYTNLDSMIHTLVDTSYLLNSVFHPFVDTTFVDHLLCDSLIYLYNAAYGGDFEPLYKNAAYGKGLGMTYYEYTDLWSLPSIHVGRQMIYAKKGPVPCGQPDNTTQDIAEETGGSIVVDCYPNPATTQLTLEFSGDLLLCNKEIKLINPWGQVLLHEDFADGITIGHLDISHLPSGTYFMHVSGPGFHPVVRKVMK